MGKNKSSHRGLILFLIILILFVIAIDLIVLPHKTVAYTVYIPYTEQVPYEVEVPYTIEVLYEVEVPYEEEIPYTEQEEVKGKELKYEIIGSKIPEYKKQWILWPVVSNTFYEVTLNIKNIDSSAGTFVMHGVWRDVNDNEVLAEPIKNAYLQPGEVSSFTPFKIDASKTEDVEFTYTVESGETTTKTVTKTKKETRYKTETRYRTETKYRTEIKYRTETKQRQETKYKKVNWIFTDQCFLC